MRQDPFYVSALLSQRLERLLSAPLTLVEAPQDSVRPPQSDTPCAPSRPRLYIGTPPFLTAERTAFSGWPGSWPRWTPPWI